MDFFDRQEHARRNTGRLVFLFGLAVAGTVLAVYAAFALIFRFDPDHPSLARLFDLRLFSGVSLGTSFVIFLGSIVKILELGGGGAGVAAMLGGQPVNPNTRDPAERKLLNVVEEMALASGVPVPQVFLLRGEAGINAFAAGLTPNNAVIGVTRGCMNLLTRDELQGVVGHEFSHILNGDMRLNLRLIGIVNGLLVLTIIGRELLRVRVSGSRNGKGGNPLPLIGIALMILGGIGAFFGRLIKSAVSRQREFLADASATQFTRNPAGLAGALKKIGGLVEGSRIESPHAEQVSHMFFSNGLADSWLAWFSTHPPLEDRIRALDPTFDGKFPVTLAEPAEEAVSSFVLDDAGAALAGDLAWLRGATPPNPALRVTPRLAVEQTGTLDREHLVYAAAVRSQLPARLLEAVREPLGACGVVLAMLLSPDAETRREQLTAIQSLVAPRFLEDFPALVAEVDRIEARQRLPLVSLAMPALCQLSPSQYDGFSSLLMQMVERDEQISLFEYTLQRMVRRHLAPQFGDAPRRKTVQYYALQPVLADCAVLLSAIAHQADETVEGVERAFRGGAERLAVGRARPELLPPDRASLDQVDAALEKMEVASAPIKRLILEACAEVVAADGVIQESEGELLRAIADALDCPIPPFIEGL